MMARIRTIKPEFTESESIGKLSRESRLLFILLWTYVDDVGRARASSRLLASRLYPYDDDAAALIDGWLAELKAAGHIRLYEADGHQYLDIPKWLEHQKIDHPGRSRIPEFRESLASPREDVRDLRDSYLGPRTIGPRTIGPRTIENPPPPSGGVPPAPKPRASGTRIPPNWRPTDAGRQFAADRGLDPDATADAFADYWTSNNGPTALKRDWDAAFRTWCRRDAARPLGASAARPVQSSRGGDAFLDQLAIIASRERDDDDHRH